MISVVVPVYKIEPYIAKCIESIIQQTFSDWELVLVDDGSPDRCGEICDTYAREDSRIRVIHQRNAGLSAARNAAMKVIQGYSVTFIDGDDFVDREHLRSLNEALEEFDADISIAGCLEVREDESPVCDLPMRVERKCITGKEACERLLRDDETFLITAWGKLYKRDLFPLVHYPEGKLNEDEYTTYRLLYESRRVAFTGRNSYKYLRRNSGITAKFTTKHLEVADAFRDSVVYFGAKNDSQMEEIAQKRLLRETRVLYLKSKGLPETARARLMANWKDDYREYRSNIAKISSLSERMANWFFYRCPSLYAKLIQSRYQSQ